MSKAKKIVRRRASKRTVITGLVARITPKIEIVPVEASATPTIEQLIEDYETSNKAHSDARSALDAAEVRCAEAQAACDAAHKAFHDGIKAALKRVAGEV